jgi:outer membrane protein assembly factor BamB
MKNISSLLLSVVLILVSASPNLATDWPQWRGSFFNGSTDEKDLPSSWSETENIAWVSSLPGPGGATPIISNGKVFVSSMVKGTKDFVALCFDAETGKQLWRKEVGSNPHNFRRNNAASPSPVADGNNVFFMYGSGDLVGFDFEGNKLWALNIEKDYGNLSVKFGYSNSPLLYNNKLFIPVIRQTSEQDDNPLESFIIAIDSKTGKTIWKQPRQTNAHSESMEAYTTPVPMLRNGKLQILNIGADFITANDPDTGKELWRFEYWTQKVRDSRIIPSLVTDNNLIIGTRYKNRGVFALLPPDSNNTGKILWEFDEAAPDVCTPLIYQGKLYVLDGKQSKLVTCLDPNTAKKFWQYKLEGRGPWRASLTAGDGKIYCINETGEIVVLKADGEKFDPEASSGFETKIDEGPIQSSISIANGHLFIRTAENLYCIGQ